MSAAVSTPVNTISRENLPVLIRNNILNESIDFLSDCDCSMMETNSPIRKPELRVVSKKLFHSPLAERSPNRADFGRSKAERSRQSRKRKQSLIPDSAEKIKRAYVQECEGGKNSPDVYEGMRKKVLVSLFHNKEYSMDFS